MMFGEVWRLFDNGLRILKSTYIYIYINTLWANKFCAIHAQAGVVTQVTSDESLSGNAAGMRCCLYGSLIKDTYTRVYVLRKDLIDHHVYGNLLKTELVHLALMGSDADAKIVELLDQLIA